MGNARETSRIIFCTVMVAVLLAPARWAQTAIVRIRTTIRSADYIDADILDKKFEIEETRETLKEELEKACAAGNPSACDDLKSLRRVRQFDLETEKVD